MSKRGAGKWFVRASAAISRGARAFQGKTPQRAYFVPCDGETTTQNDIELGVINILLGFAPLKQAEFVVLRIQ